MGLCIHIYDWLSFSFAVFMGGLRIIKYHTLPSSTEESGKCLKMLQFPNSAVGFSSKYFGALELRVCVCMFVCVCQQRVLSVFCPAMWTPQIINASILIVLRDDGEVSFQQYGQINRSEKRKEKSFPLN